MNLRSSGRRRSKEVSSIVVVAELSLYQQLYIILLYNIIYVRGRSSLC